MADAMDRLSMEEALACIKLHFTKPEGLIAQVERGISVDNAQVEMIKVALQRIHMTWEKQNLVPKQDVRLLWGVLPRLEECLRLYPDRELEIRNLYMQIGQWIDEVFAIPTMSEETAIAVVSQHILGPSFVMELRFHSMNENAREDLFMALDTLAKAWSNKERISKLAAGAMISVQDLSADVSWLHSDVDKKHLQEIIHQLFERINRCLS